MITTPVSRATAEAYIRERIERESRETDPVEVDVDAIADDLFAAADGTWDISGVDEEIYQAIVERHAPAAARRR